MTSGELAEILRERARQHSVVGDAADRNQGEFEGYSRSLQQTTMMIQVSIATAFTLLAEDLEKMP